VDAVGFYLEGGDLLVLLTGIASVDIRFSRLSLELVKLLCRRHVCGISALELLVVLFLFLFRKHC
jgi:hypothetical protein